MNKYTKLINNSIIFAVGNLGSKFINFLLVPLYTNYLSTSEYGSVDLITTTVNLLVPILSLELGLAVMRFAIESNEEPHYDSVFSNVTFYGLMISVILFLSIPIINSIQLFGENSIFFIILLILYMFNGYYSNFVRGIGKVKSFALNGILMALVNVTLNIVFLTQFQLGIKGYLLSLSIALLVSNVFLFYISSGIQRLRLQYINKSEFILMASYSVPLISNSMIWWLINSSSRYFITYFHGINENGLYATASKIPSLISIVTNVFLQAWQLSSFEEYESNDKDRFFSNIFSIYTLISFLVVSFILVNLKYIISILVGGEFFESWRMVPFILVASVYQSFASFLGTNYSAAKQTKGSLFSAIYGAMTSLIANFILVPFLGGIGAGIAGTISFVVVFLVRLRDTSKYVEITIDISKFLGSNLIILIQVLVLYHLENIPLLVTQSILFIIIILINRKLIINIVSRTLKIIKNINLFKK